MLNLESRDAELLKPSHGLMLILGPTAVTLHDFLLRCLLECRLSLGFLADAPRQVPVHLGPAVPAAWLVQPFRLVTAVLVLKRDLYGRSSQSKITWPSFTS